MVRPTRLHRPLVLLVAVVLVVPVAARPAAADSVGDLNAQAERIAARRDALQHDAEVLAEQQNAAQVALADVDRDLAAVNGKLLEQDSQLDSLRAQLAKFAVRTYQYGDLTTGLGTIIGDIGNDSSQRAGYSAVILGGAVDLADQVRAVRGDTDKLNRDLLAKQNKQQELTAAIEKKRAALAQADQQLAALAKNTSADLRAAIAQRDRLRAAADAAAFEARRKQLADRARADAAKVATTPAKPTVRRTTSGTPATTTPTGKPSPKPRPAPPAPPSVSGAAGRAVSAAYSQIGVPYGYATSIPGKSFDCSGLTSWAWAQAGVSIPRTSQSQWAGLPHVPLDQIQPGDLIFYYSDVHHVAIYVGNNTVIHAPYSGSTVSFQGLAGQIIGAARPG